jgi:hypothetical protein
LNWTKDHHVVVCHIVAGIPPVDEPAITSMSEGAGIEDVGLIAFCEVEYSKVKFKVVVLCILEVDSGILIMVNNDVLVGELQRQFPDHSGGEELLCGMLIISPFVDALDQFFDELCADSCDCYEALVTIERIWELWR